MMAFVLTRGEKILAGSLVLVLTFTTVGVRHFYGLKNERHPEKFLIPSGYVGWIIIEHGLRQAPPTKVEGDYLVYRFPLSGRLKTSTPMGLGVEKGNTEDIAYYVTSERLIQIPESWPNKHNASDVLVWGRGIYGAIPEERIPLIEVAFIGTESQYARANVGPPPKSEEQQARDKTLKLR